MLAELALVREAGVRGDLRQGQVVAALQELLGALDAAQDDVLVRRQPGGPLELPREVVGVPARVSLARASFCALRSDDTEVA